MKVLQISSVLLAAANFAHAQVNSGSNGSDGSFNPTTNTVINMADRPNGIYQYTSVNIPANVTVSFIPNANNTPVVWLVQSNCFINGTVNIAGQNPQLSQPKTGGLGGPGGFAGGSGQLAASIPPTQGLGPGGGMVDTNHSYYGGNGSFGTVGGGASWQHAVGSVYGNNFLLPLIGGSGGGGSHSQIENGGTGGSGGTGGGGAILIAATVFIEVNGSINASGGPNDQNLSGGGGGSGGAVRLIATTLRGNGYIDCGGGIMHAYNFGAIDIAAGKGRIRFDTLDNRFGGTINGVFTQGFQPAFLPVAGQVVQLTVTSVGGVTVSSSPTGQQSTPDAVLSAQQNNPIPVVVHCSNIPLNTQITVTVKPANGAAVNATGFNNTGTFASSTATIAITMPRGGGLIYATAATGN